MATIHYFDAKGVVSKQSLLGETGYLALNGLFNLPDGSEAICTNSTHWITQLISVWRGNNYLREDDGGGT